MGKSKQEQTQNTNQQFAQQQQQDTSQQQTAVQAQEQATSSLQQMLQNFLTQNQQQQATTATNTSELAPLQQPAASQYFTDLMKQYLGGGLDRSAYQGERVAALTPEQLQAQNMAKAYATGGGTDFANQALTTSGMLLDPNQILNPANVPGLAATKAANAQALTRNLTEQQLPYIRSQALATGGYGGSRQGIAEGLATGRTNEAIANANAGMDMSAYSQGLSAMQNALGLSPSTFNLGSQPANVVASVGAQNQAQQQAQNVAGQQAFQEQQAAPSQTLALLQSLMGTQGQYGGTTTGTQAGTSTGTTTGQQSSTQMAQQLASMLGLNLADMTGTSSGTASGTQQGTSTSTLQNTPSLLQNLAAIAGLATMPWTFGLSAPKP